MTPGQRVLYLVRHGQMERLAAGARPASRLGNRLTPLGREQAELTAQRLSELPIHTVHHSTLHRARETAEIIAARLPGATLRSSPLLRECIPFMPRYFVDWYTNLSREELRNPPETTPPEMKVWLSMWPWGTPWLRMQRDHEQARKAYDYYFRPTRGPERHEAIVCHGNIIRYFVCRALQAPPEAWINTDINNCGICEIAVKPDGSTMLLSHNDTGHMPYSMHTFI